MRRGRCVLRMWRSERGSQGLEAAGAALAAALIVVALLAGARSSLGPQVLEAFQCAASVLTGGGGCDGGAAEAPGTPAAQQDAPEQDDGGFSLLDGVQLVLDGVGLIPGLGEIADGANGVISLLRGDKAGAALSFAAMIPFAGWFATGGKWVRTGVKYSDEAAAVVRSGDEAAAAARQLPCVGAARPGGKGPGLATPLAAPCPLGFRNVDEFQQFGDDLYDGLRRAGYNDAEAVMQGSSVTGRSADSGLPFDAGRTSDFDVGIGSESAFVRALDDPGLQKYYKTGPERIGPIKAGSPEARALGLDQLLNDMSQKAGREVNIMLYPSPSEMYRGPSFPIPRTSQ